MDELPSDVGAAVTPEAAVVASPLPPPVVEAAAAVADADAPLPNGGHPTGVVVVGDGAGNVAPKEITDRTGALNSPHDSANMRYSPPQSALHEPLP